MERLQGPINDPCFLVGEHLDIECFQQETTFGFSSYGQLVGKAHSLGFDRNEQEEEAGRFLSPLTSSGSLEEKMPFLDMLESVESPPFFPLCKLSFQALLSIQHHNKSFTSEVMEYCSFGGQVQAPEQSKNCSHSPSVESQSKLERQQHPEISTLYGTGGSVCKEEQAKAVEGARDARLMISPAEGSGGRENRKRRTKREAKSKEELERQRMTHIAVERNRRRQMNQHLAALRSLMPSSYLRRGDQASVIGGAIDFVQELEQLLESLQAKKKMRKAESSSVGCCETATFTKQVERKSGSVEVKVRVIHKHVNLRMECPREPRGHLLHAILALQHLGLMVLHLNITSMEASVRYSFSLKMEDECKVGSAEGIAEAVLHGMLSFITDTEGS
ncbi:transcription factor bHLH57-like [Diospyros lotus]|uniref:transcription factor bHLH57-like n=1 Tax=Diospyros lotus TaxID=55363 RepID=UPI002250BC62|nr:transcription factor bHLH57-like [Diospyros lotus]